MIELHSPCPARHLFLKASGSTDFKLRDHFQASSGQYIRELFVEGKNTMANILIVDDQKWVLDLFSEELIREGHNISVTNDIQSVKDDVCSFNPDFVLLNLYLKAGFAAWDVLLDIKKQNSRLPVVIVTAHATYLHDPRLALANGHVIKTCFAPAELKEKISKTLS